MALDNGARVGSYEILAPIGAGGMGEVYRARDVELGRTVAVKVLPEEVAGDPERLARFEREARALAALNHPKVAALFGFFKEVLRSGPDAAHGDSQDVLGLTAAHDGIVHRDLKPANVKIGADEERADGCTSRVHSLHS